MNGPQTQKKNYEEAWTAATEGRIEDIDKKMLICHYSVLNKIATEHAPMPEALDYEAQDTPNVWFYGPTGTGIIFFFIIIIYN